MQIKSVIMTVFLVLVVVSVLFISVFGNSILDFLQVKYSISNNISNILHASKIGVYFILFIVLLLMYRFVPGHKRGLKMQIPGAIIGTIGWYVVSLIFSGYLETFKGFSVMYGSLTTIMLVIMWTYTCIYTLFLGAEINKLIKILKAK